jgi:L-lactate dehydrogenase complex protein LldG
MVEPAPVTARDEILRRVRTAEPVPRAYRRGESDAGVELLRERLADYRAEVRVLPSAELQRAIEAVCHERGATRVAVPPALPAEWRPRAREVVEDDGLSPLELDRIDGVVTGCTLAIAETGTLVLAAGPHEGRRALTLVPDLHVCVVGADQIVGGVPAAFARLDALVREERRPLTFVSGPSATSDIELSRVEGVHGPRQLVVLIVDGAD